MSAWDQDFIDEEEEGYLFSGVLPFLSRVYKVGGEGSEPL
jgi:hypothetical protein